MENSEKKLKALHDLAATNNDASEGFGKAAKGVHEKQLSDWLAQASADRDRFVDEIESIIRHMGGDQQVDLHEGGILHKGWVDLEQRLRSNEPHLRSKDDKEILRECIAGDGATLAHYDHALMQQISDDARTTLLQQRASVTDQQTYLQQLIGE